MILYVAFVYFDYEGSEVIGIFDSRNAAQEACNNHKYRDGNLRGDSRQVEEYELNKARELKI